MDNASKALIIVGEILLGILLLSLMVAVFILFGNFSAEMHKHMTESQRTEFNSNFLSLEYRTNIKAQEIVTLINYVKQSNDAKELEYNTRTESDYYTTVWIDGADVFNSSAFVNTADQYNNELKSKLDNFIKNNNTYYFSCNATIKKNGSNLKTEYKEYSDEYTSEDIVYNRNTGLINKIVFHKIDPSIANVLK